MIDNNFDDSYLNTQLEDGLSVKEHIEKNYNTVISYSNPKLSDNFNTNLENQYKFVLNNIHNRSKTFEINKYEEIFIKKFLEKLLSLKKRYWVTLERYGNGSLMFYYNAFIVGRINLRDIDLISMQILTTSKAKNYSKITFEQSLVYIDKWYNYIKYHLS